MKKIHLRNLETNETITFEFSDECTLHDLQLKIKEPSPSSVRLSIHLNDELLEVSSQATLQSLGVKSGDIISYSLDSSDCSAVVPKSETNHQATEAAESGSVPRSQNEAEAEELGGMNLSGLKRLSEPLFLKKILMEKCGDTWELTTVVMTVHAVMLESGFVLFGPDLGLPFSFADVNEVSLKYTLPSSVIASGSEVVITLKFENLGDVEVYGYLNEEMLVDKVSVNKSSYMHAADLLMETSESDNEDTLRVHHREVRVWWRRIKDCIVTPLLVDLCYKLGLELPPCFVILPRELKHKILEQLHGVDIAALACVSTELRELTSSDNELWKQKCLEVCKDLVRGGNDEVNWKERFAGYWRQHGKFSMIRARAIESCFQITRIFGSFGRGRGYY
ncbi:hypothetical protein CARUB_v10020430mg [Capsella rubella]|uniref:F-box domain-containing protein n=1 Tax=Capsella rubella TaxID=81985 RepID=R0GHQ0_9BRAS|nr:F-box protein SKIP22 [Capsella rubella]EOA35261.1 hypothetical protein CARUB_v10020430mg [Capsella rubella]